MKNELGRIWKEVVVPYCKILSRHLPGGTEKNHKNHQSRQVFGPRYETATSRIQSRSAKHLAVTFRDFLISKYKLIVSSFSLLSLFT
jgi:hypothetical protein